MHSDGQIAAFRGFLEGHGEICVAGIKNAYMHFGDAVKTSMDGLSALFSQLSLERVLRPLPEITLRLKYPENKTQPIGNTHSLLAPVGTALPESERDPYPTQASLPRAVGSGPSIMNRRSSRRSAGR